ncbi:MAG: hypothetical protein HYV28_15285 [Ignavibacteriales bacterium]|nr:hypothetical protein [Ignavibacteriales bacterium]
MKRWNACLYFIVLLLFVFNFRIYGQSPQQPEFYFYIYDDPGADYLLKARKADSSPSYGRNFEHVTENGFIYDRIINGVPHWTPAPPEGNQAAKMGYDWVRDLIAGNGGRGVLNHGIYNIYVIRNNPSTPPYYTETMPVFSFTLDLRFCGDLGIHSPDIIFKIYRNAQGSITATYSVDNADIPFQANAVLNFWELFAHLGTKDWSEFVREAVLQNDFDGQQNTAVPIKLVTASEGFPYSQHPVNTDFTSGTELTFWKGSTYGFTVTDQPV